MKVLTVTATIWPVISLNVYVSQSSFLSRLKFEFEQKIMKKLSQIMVYVLVFFYFCIEFGCSSLKFNDGSEWNFSGCYSNQVLLLILVLKPSCFTVGHSGSLIFANYSPQHTCKHFFGSAVCRRALHLIVRSWPNKIHNASFGVVYLVDLQAVWISTPNPA